MRNHLLACLLALTFAGLAAQNNNQGTISGSLELNGNFFIRDSAIGAFNLPQYDRQLFGADAWMDIKYSNWGFDFGLRFDLFNNSNLLNPQGSYTDQGIGRWYIRKQLEKLDIEVGYIYDAVGSGLLYRFYEVRPLAIDNALNGVKLGYQLTPNIKVKAFTGRQKRQFDLYGSIIKGMTIEGFLSIGADEEAGKAGWSIAPGAGVIHRTLDDNTVDLLVGTIATYTQADRIGAKYNVLGFNAYNTLSVGSFTWYIEGAYKSGEPIFDPFAPKQNFDGSTSLGKFLFEEGYVAYTSLSYAMKGFGISAEYKRTDHFGIRASPFASLNQGLINFLPPMTRVNTYRLTARYAPASLELGEQAVQVEARYSPSKKLSFLANFANITDLDGGLLYRELYGMATFKKSRKYQLNVGIQRQQYNQEIYEVKPNAPIVEALTPFFDFSYNLSRKKTIRFEGQYMNTEQDFGSWLFGLVEYSVAPKWIVTISDMYNIDPKRTEEALNYYTASVTYINRTNRFEFGYVKQVEGIVCSGGICRLEPAFNGLKLNVRSTF